MDNIQAETEQAVDITTEEPEISDVYSGPTVTLAMVGDVLLHTRWKKAVRQRMALMIFPVFFANVKEEVQAADIAIVNRKLSLAERNWEYLVIKL